jgi:hypothetical protein
MAVLEIEPEDGEDNQSGRRLKWEAEMISRETRRCRFAETSLFHFRNT